MIGCSCDVCLSPNPKNHRTRASVLLKLPAGNLLIDTTPELRVQFIRERIPYAHAILYTHYHADHLFGLDDVRLFPKYLGGPLPIYCAEDVEEVIRMAFGYAFHPGADDMPAGVLPRLVFHRIATEPFEVLGQTITPIPLVHARFQVLGFRIGNVAYCTDVSEIPEGSWPLLEGLDVLILDALRPTRPHPSHMALPQALEVVKRVKPQQTYLTHMSHEMDYTTVTPKLPRGVALAYDGLTFDF